jgi:biopolymer transport protein ExbD
MAIQVGDNEMEINLTPLLDLILQLIMFFLACVSFVSDEVSSNVRLPDSSSAQEIQPKTESEYIVINIELLRQERRAPSGEIIRDAKGQPLRDPIEPHTFKFRIIGGEDITFVDNPASKAAGLAKAMQRMRLLAEKLRLRLAAREHKGSKDIKRINIPVIVRADVETEYALIYLLIEQCRNSGFPRVELRANTIRER